jgi:hypothetical protein
VSIISATPDLIALCRDLLGAELSDAQRIGTGRNSRVFRVMVRAPELAAGTQTFVMKFYRRDPGDTRERALVEFGGLTFLWQNGVRTVPHPIKADAGRDCAVYEYIAGEPAGGGSISDRDIDACVDFLAELKHLRAGSGSERLPAASEACFSLADVEKSVRSRLARLRASDSAGDGRALHEWIERTLAPLADRIVSWGHGHAEAASIDWDEPLRHASRILSPSDFGFHNAIRRPDGALAFVDFEYFGWDDPAKTIVDFLLHPGMALPEPRKARFARRMLDVFADVPGIAARSRIAYPMFGLKWCSIVLNDFLPERRPASSADTRAAQFAKASAMAQQIEQDYRANRYLM